MPTDLDNYLQANQRIRSLLLILIFVLVASGIALAVLVQIRNYETEQRELNENQVEIILPEKHKVQTNLLKIEN